MDELKKRLSHLSPKQREILLNKLKEKNKRSPNSGRIGPRKDKNRFPLSFAQERLWFLQQLAPDSPFYNMPMALLIKGKFDISFLKNAIRELIKSHQILRAYFPTQPDGKPKQKIAESIKLPFFIFKIKDDQQEIAYRIQQEISKVFDLKQTPLVRFILFNISPYKSILLINLHHIIADGWSVNILIDELIRLYRQFAGGNRPKLSPMPLDYVDYAEWQNHFIDSPAIEKQLRYWQNYLKNMPQFLELETDFPRPPVQNYEGRQHFYHLDTSVFNQLIETARTLSISPYALFLAATNIFLYKLTSQKDFGIGIPLANRHRKEIEKIIGFFVNTGVIRAKIDPFKDFGSYAQHIHNDILLAAENQDIPFEKIVEVTEENHDISRAPLFQVMFDLQRIPFTKLEIDNLEIYPYDFKVDVAKFDLLFLLTDYHDHLKISLEYNTQIFADDTVALWIHYYAELLRQIARSPEKPISKLTLIPKEKESELVRHALSFRQKYPNDKSVVELFEKQVSQRPEAIAVSYSGKTFTYRQINQMANRLAHYIQHTYPTKQPYIGLFMNKSPWMITAIIAILKLGKGYVAMDAKYPAKRIAFILQDTATDLVLTDSELKNNLPENGFTFLAIDEQWEQIKGQPDANPDISIAPDYPMYVIFTSGSTGIPKGVAVPHRGVVRLVFNQNYIFLGPEETVGFLASIAFDASVFEIWAALLHGARLAIFPSQTPSLSEIGTFFQNEHISIQLITTGLFHLLVDGQLPSLINIRQILAGGDVLSPEHLKKLFSQMPKDHYFIPVYGPTENSTFTTCLRMPDLSTMRWRVPIGISIHNTEVYVLDEYLNLVPPGVPGELYTAGDGLAHHYVNRPDLTAASFLPNPFSATPDARMYKTGDLVRQRADGILEFIGRIDNQVKIRGYRIELGEIESVLKQHSAIRDTVVSTFEESPGDKLLVAYLISKQKNDPELIRELKEFLQNRLPSFMVPDAFVFLETFPLTTSGKVDRKALPRPRMNDVAPKQRYIPPSNPLEEYLANLWKEVLSVERVGIRDNFFDLGGNSLKAAVFINRLQQEFHHEVPVTAVFKAPTIKQLSAYILEYFEEDVKEHLNFKKEGTTIKITIDDVVKKLTDTDVRTFRQIIKPLPPYTLNNKKKNPPVVFILSPPRSGSTLFRVMLAGNPKLFSPPELDLLSFNTLAERKETFNKPGLEIWLEATIRTLMELKHCSFEEAKAVMDEFERQNLPIKSFYDQLQTWMGDRILVDKTPTYPFDPNVLERGEEYFDNTYYIHLIRHPYAMIYSFIEAKLDQNFFRYTHPFSRRELAELIWIVSNQNILSFFEKIPAERKFQIRFEDLLANPDEKLHQVCSFLNIEFSEEMLKPYHGNKMTDGARQHSQMVGDFKFYLHKDINPRVASKWKKHHSSDFLSDIAWELAQYFGYPVEKHLAKSLSDDSFAIKPMLKKNNIPLSFAQQRLWFLDQLEPGQAIYNIPLSLRIIGPFNKNILKKAWEQLIRRHASFRTIFSLKAGQPRQIIKDDLFAPIEYYSSSVTPKMNIEEIIKKDALKPFDLSKGPLVRAKLFNVKNNEHIFYVNMHHIISDGLSIGIVIKDLTELYNAIVEKRAAKLPLLSIQYADFATWQRHFMRGEHLEKELQFWQEQFKDAPELLELPYDRPRPYQQTFSGKRLFFEISESTTAKINHFAHQLKTTPFTLLLSVFQVLLYRYSRQKTILIGTPVANRNRKEIEHIVGFFVNTLVIRGDFSQTLPFKTLVEQLKAQITEVFSHQDLPFEKIIDHLKIERSLSHNPLFQVMFAYQPSVLRSMQFKDLQIDPIPIDVHISKFDITLSMADVNGKFQGEWEYNTDLFNESTSRQMIRHFIHLLDSVVDNAEKPVLDLPLLSDSEINKIIHEFNAIPIVNYPSNKLIHTLFEEQVRKYPDNIALIYKGRTLTYRELNEKANQLAHYLIEKGVKPEQFVGIFMEKSFEVVIAVFAILKAGGAYIPLDYRYPFERLQYVIEDSGLQLILTHRSLDRSLQDCTAELLNMDFLQDQLSSMPSADPGIQMDGQNIAYVIYTSGSTGKPKGVMVQHNTIIVMAYDYIHNFQIVEDTRLLQYFSFSFDASVADFFMSLFSGARLYLVDKDEMMPDSGLTDLIRDNHITNAVLPPSLLSVLPANEFPNLTILASGGDVCPPELAKKWATPNRKYWNAYGPTETTVCATWYLTNHLPRNAVNVPIGVPIPHYRIYILDQKYQPLPIGVPGEMFIAGAGVTRGYLNRPDLTAEKFLPDPFSDKRGARMYASGDLCRYLPDGNIEFLGRIDQQVKIRGFRIELGEIEATLLGHKNIKEAVVIAKGQAGSKQLAAYVVNEEGSSLTIGEIRGFLSKRLPEYMMPAYFVFMDQLPVTSAGKIDKKRLPEPSFSRDALENEFIAPRNNKEAVLAAIWQDLLNLKQIGVKDNFFELGGDSILSIQVVSRSNQKGLKITPKQLFEHPTIEGLASVAQEGVAIHAEQGIVSGQISLTPIQLWFFELDLAKPEHWNQALALELTETLDVVAFNNALHELVKHHDMLRAGFNGGKATIYSDRAVPFKTYDLSLLSAKDYEKALNEVARELQGSFDLGHPPLLRVGYIKTPEGKADLLQLVLHHLIVDGISWRILLEDLLSAYQQLQSGAAVKLPPKTTSFKYWSEKLRSLADSQTLEEELAYWHQIAADAVPGLSFDFADGSNDERSAKQVVINLTQEETDALLKEAPSAYQTQVNELLLTALARALHRLTGYARLYIDLEGHGREDLFEDVDISRTVGWFTVSYPFVFNFHSALDMGALIKALKEAYRRIPNHGIGYGVLRYIRQEETLAHLPSAHIGFNYLGRFDQAQNRNFGKTITPMGAERAPQNRRIHPLEISGSVQNNILTMHFLYGAKVYKKETIQKLAKLYLEELRAVIEHCLSSETGGYTASDFHDAGLDEDAFNDLLDELE